MMKSSASSTVSNLSAAAASHSQDPNYQRRAYHLMQRKMVGTLRFAHPTLLEKSGGQTPLGRAGQPAGAFHEADHQNGCGGAFCPTTRLHSDLRGSFKTQALLQAAWDAIANAVEQLALTECVLQYMQNR